MLILVSPSAKLFNPLSYNYSGPVEMMVPGRRVVIPLGRRFTTGWVVGTESDYSGPTKSIIGYIDDVYLPDRCMLDFVARVSREFFLSQGELLDYTLPPKKKSIKQLTADCFKSGRNVSEVPFAEMMRHSRAGPIIFSYKTKDREKQANQGLQPISGSCFVNELWLAEMSQDRYAEKAGEWISKGLSVLMVVPDYPSALCIQEGIPDSEIFMSHTKISQRENTWKRVFQSQPLVIVGGLAALFLPFRNLGCIIVDRPLTPAYRWGYRTSIHLPRVARLRAETYNLTLIDRSPLKTLSASSGFAGAEISELRGDRGISVAVSRIKAGSRGMPDGLLERLKELSSQDRRVLILLNRRQTSRYFYCPSCQKIQRCPRCRGILIAADEHLARCLRCDFKNSAMKRCTSSECAGDIQLLEDVTLESLARDISRMLPQQKLATFDAKDWQTFLSSRETIAAQTWLIATPAVLNPFFRKQFNNIVYIRPESVFNMNEYDAAELIHSVVWEMKELIMDNGVIDIFSAFFFHYSLSLVNDEEGFLKRELKYRQWFRLPPFSQVYRLELRDRNLRQLGRNMRRLFRDYKRLLGIERIFLLSRRPIKGWFRAVMTLHTSGAELAESELLNERFVQVKPEIL